VRSGRIAAEILSAVNQVNRDSLRVVPSAFDERFGSAALRQAILRGSDAGVVMDAQQPAVATFLRSAARFRLYR
jgi:hypothetical protein